MIATMVRVLACFVAFGCGVAHAADARFPDVTGDERFAFPRDHGAHPDFRTEWWYVTGSLHTDDGDDVGFQVTFFRSRIAVDPAADNANPSRFAPRQLLFAHAAIADPKVGHLIHDQRIARAGFGIARASEADADVALDGWRLARVSATDAPLRFRTHVDGSELTLDLELVATGPLIAQGADAARPGYSQKGPAPRDASRYYSVPQLAVTGRIARGSGAAHNVTGRAWLDREWSSAYLDPAASGWDWVGLNLDDGGSLMAFRMRDRDGAKLWAGGTHRFADGRVERLQPGDVTFTTLREWTSSRSATRWPVSQRLAIGGGASPLSLVLDPVMDDQELDSRASTGTIYWEGAVRVREDGAAGKRLGTGYLELTGYWKPLRLGLD